MPYRLLADVVAVAHGLFLVYVALGGFLAWRWPRATWSHIVAVAWGVGIVVIGWDCPLTGLEEWLGRRGGVTYHRGFIDRDVKGVVYPARFTLLVQLLVVAAILISWYGAFVRHRSRVRSVRLT